MAFALPFILSAIPGLLSGAASIYQMAKGKGGRIKRKRYISNKKRKGRGPISQILGTIPLLGSILGPISSALGAGKRKRRHIKYPRKHKARGLQIDYYAPSFGRGMIKRKRVHRRKTYRKRGYGMLFPPGGQRMLAKALYGQGLLMPAGGKTFRVKGHYRYTPTGKRVHVKGHTSGRGLIRPRVRLHSKIHSPKIAGYLPYKF